MIRTSAPGKLFIAGEYAVTQSGCPAILVAIDRFIELSLEKTLDRGRIYSYGRKPTYWTRDGGKIALSERNSQFEYVFAAINIVESYAEELGKSLDFYNIDIYSQLETKEGRKYGLGSSAAVTVATIRALCTYYEISISNVELFKLAALANLVINPDASCGDIGACVYGGWIAFTTFDVDWLLKSFNKNSISQLLRKEWPKLSIESLSPPSNLELLVGWTGNPASTIDILGRVNDRKFVNSSAYNQFLNASTECVIKMIYYFKKGSLPGIQKQIRINRQLLIDMGKELDILIETPLLTKLSDLALSFGGASKASGAGGGDCGIAILKGDRYKSQLIGEWGKVGISYLPLSVYNI